METEPEAATTSENVTDISEDIVIEEVSIDGMCGVY